METVISFATLLLGLAAVAMGAAATALVALYANISGQKGWYWSSLLMANLALVAVNIDLPLLFPALAGMIMSASASAGATGIWIAASAFGSAVNVSLVFVFPLMLAGHGLIGPVVKRVFLGVAYVAAAFQLATLTGRILITVVELPWWMYAGNIGFLIDLAALMVTMVGGRKRGGQTFAEYVKGSLPLIFTFLPFLAYDTFGRLFNWQGTSAVLGGVVAYFVALFAYTGIHFYSALTHWGSERAAAPADGMPSPVERFGLSPREAEVFALMMEGRGNQGIAEKLFVSVATVKTHTNRIFQKTGARNRLELFAMLKLPGGSDQP